MGLVAFEEDDQADEAANLAARMAYDTALDAKTDEFLTAFKEQVFDDDEANQQFHDYFSTERLAGILHGTEDTAEGGIQLKHNSREYFSRGVQVRLDWEGELGGAHHDVEVGLRYHEDEEDRIQRIDAYTQKDGRLILHDAGDWGHQSAGNRLQEAEAVSVYVHDRIEWGAWVLTPGFRYEDIEQMRTRWKDPEPDNVRANVRSTRKNDTSVFLPGMGVLYNVNDNWSVLAGYHKGFSAPSNSPGVEEEEADNYELGVRYAGTYLRGEVIAFYSDYENLLGECTASSGANCEVGDSFNGDAATVEGVETMFVADVPLSETLNLPLSLSYTYIDTEFDTSFESEFFGDVEKGDPIPYIPEHQLRVSMGLEETDWSVNLSGKYVDEVCVQASCGAFEKTDSSFHRGPGRQLPPEQEHPSDRTRGKPDRPGRPGCPSALRSPAQQAAYRPARAARRELFLTGRGREPFIPGAPETVGKVAPRYSCDILGGCRPDGGPDSGCRYVYLPAQSANPSNTRSGAAIIGVWHQT